MSDPLAILNFSWIENKTEVVELSQGQFIAYMADILLYVIFNLQYRFLLFAPIAKFYVGSPERSFFLRFIFFAAYFLRYFKGCLVLTASINRCTSVLAHRIHEKIWKYAFGISLLCSFLIALSLSWFYFFGKILLVPMDAHEVTYGLSPQVDLFPSKSSLKLALFGLVYGSLDLIVNIITCVAIIYERHKSGSFKKVAIGLMIITLIEFITQILVFVVEGKMFILGEVKIYDGVYNDFYFAMCWITDLNTLLKPYTLLLMSKAVRQPFLKTYWGNIGNPSVVKIVFSKI